MKMRNGCMLRVPNLLVPTFKWNNLISAADITEKHVGQIAEFFRFLNNGKAMHAYKPQNIINCDETPVYFNNIAKKTVQFTKEKVVAVKIMEGNPRARVKIMLATIADGRLLEPCMIEASQSKAAKSDAGSTKYERNGLTVWKQENHTMKYLTIQPVSRNTLGTGILYSFRQVIHLDSFGFKCFKTRSCVPTT